MATPVLIQKYRTQQTIFLNAGALVQPIWQAGPNGSRIHAISFTQTDTNAGVLQLFQGKVLTDNALCAPNYPRYQGLPPVLAITKAATDTVTRTNGSFIADGWRVGQICFAINENVNPQNQVLQIVTTVAAATLSLGANIFNATDATPGAGLQLVMGNLLDSITNVSGAGNTNAVPALNLMSTTNFPSFLPSPDTFLLLDSFEYLLLSVATAPASTKQYSCTVYGGDY